MKQFALYFNIVLIAALGLILFALVLPTGKVMGATPEPTAQLVTADCDASRSVHVTGSAQVNVTPDRALVQLGVVSNATTVAAVEQANTKAIQQVMAAIKEQGVEAKDIATDLYMIEPVYENYDSLSIKGYRINNTVAVTVREVSKTSAIVAAALTAGANQVNDIGFYTSELRKYRDQARELAMNAAKEKADALATAAGAETGCVLSIGENSSSYYNGWWYGSARSASMMTQNVLQNAAQGGVAANDAASDEPISLGQISVKAEVDVSYALN
jgi:uncharacterized protein